MLLYALDQDSPWRSSSDVVTASQNLCLQIRVAFWDVRGRSAPHPSTPACVFLSLCVSPIIVFERDLQPRFSHVGFINQPRAFRELQVLTFVYFHWSFQVQARAGREITSCFLLLIVASFGVGGNGMANGFGFQPHHIWVSWLPTTWAFFDELLFFFSFILVFSLPK